MRINMDAKKAAWIAICVGVGAIFAGAIGESLGLSHAIALIFAVLGGVLGVLIGRYIG
jgi:hypothetical protein